MRILKHILYAVLSNIIFGALLYFSYTWLATYSLLLGYFGNLALILMALIVDETTIKSLESARLLKKASATERQQLRWFVDSFVSFKAVLYFFFIIVLILSQVIQHDPTLIGGNAASFLLANEYGIILVVSLDQLVQQLSRDRRRMKRVSALFDEHFEESH